MGKQIRFVSLALVALFAAVALVACGEGDDETIVEEATRIVVEGAPTELPTPDVLALTAEAATAEAEAAAEEAAAASPVAEEEGAAAPAVRLEGYDIGWRTADQPGPQVDLTLPPGAVIELVNVGAGPHNFTAEDLGLVVDMPVGFSGTVTIPADAAPGTYDFVCTVPGHAPIMFGTITVDPNAAVPGGEEVAPPAASPGAAASPEAAVRPAAGEEAAGEVAQPVRLEGFDIGWRTADQGGPQVDLTVAPGTVLELVNVGAAPHNFALDARNNEGLADLGISVDMPVGETVTAEIPADAPPGTYYFYCNVPGHEAAGMYGTITIDPNASAPVSEAEAASPEASPATAPAASPAAADVGGAPPTIRLEGYDIGWRTADQGGPEVALTLAPGATIELVNVGAAPHNFQSDDLGINQDMPVGFSGTVAIPADAAPGTYEFICNVPGHAAVGMVGTITVDPNATVGGGEPSGTPPASPAAGGEEAPVTAAVRLEGYDIGWRTADQGGPEVALTVSPGTVIELVNVGAAPHNFQAEDLGINEDMPVGYEGSVTIPEDAEPGTYDFICNVPGHAAVGMVGTITIE